MAEKPRIGAAIRDARERLMMTQDELAALAKASRSAVNAWENDRAYPRNRIGVLEKILGISLRPAAAISRALTDLAPPADEWEAGVFADPDLPDTIKRRFILDSRAARAAYRPGSGTGSPAPEDRRQAAG